MIYMFCLYHFSLKCIIKKIIYQASVPLNYVWLSLIGIGKVNEFWFVYEHVFFGGYFLTNWTVNYCPFGPFYVRPFVRVPSVGLPSWACCIDAFVCRSGWPSNNLASHIFIFARKLQMTSTWYTTCQYSCSLGAEVHNLWVARYSELTNATIQQGFKKNIIINKYYSFSNDKIYCI